MALPMPISSTIPSALKSSSIKPQSFLFCFPHLTQPSSSPLISVSFPIPNCSFTRLRAVLCRAAKSQTESVKKRSSSTGNKKKKKKSKGEADEDSGDLNLSDDEIANDFSIVGCEDGPSTSNSSLDYHPMPLPKPPAGFVVDEYGKVLQAGTKRLATIVSSLYIYN